MDNNIEFNNNDNETDIFEAENRLDFSKIDTKLNTMDLSMISSQEFARLYNRYLIDKSKYI